MSQRTERFLYRMRAECMADALKAMTAIYPYTLTVTENYLDPADTGSWIPDVDVVFTSELSLYLLNFELSKIEDSHVMRETLALASDYTGERNG